MPAATTFATTIYANYHRLAVKIVATQAAGWDANTIAITGHVFMLGEWVPVHDFLVDDANTVASTDAGAVTLWGSVWGPKEGATYPLSLTFTRTKNSDSTILESIPIVTSGTTRLTPPRADSAAKWVAPNGNDTTGDGSYETPYKTLKKAAQTIAATAGATIWMKNGTYNRDNYTGADAFSDFAQSTTSWFLIDDTTSNLVGTPSAYKSIKAETNGSVIISGKRLVTTVAGSWTRISANIYRSDYSSYMDTTDKCASKWLVKEAKTASITSSATSSGKVQLTVASGHNLTAGDKITISGHSVSAYNTTGRITAVGATTLTTDITYSSDGSGGTWTSTARALYHCRSLADDQTSAPFSASNPWKALNNVTFEAFVIDWTNNHIYVRTPTDTAPAANTYSTGFEYGRAMAIFNCDYMIIEGLTFEMFGSLVKTATDDFSCARLHGLTNDGVEMYSDNTNVIFRDCNFNMTRVGFQQSADDTHQIITIEGGGTTGHNWWDQFLAGNGAHDSTTTWAYIKNTSNEDYLGGPQLYRVPQLVVRRHAFYGGDDGLNMDGAGGAGHLAADIYECSFTNMFDGAIESNAQNSIMNNCAIWSNTFTNCLWGIRFTALTNGPVWVIGNVGTDAGVYNSLYFGAPADGAASDAHVLCYFNTMLVSTVQNPEGGANVNMGFGTARAKFINNVFVHPFNFAGDTAFGGGSYSTSNPAHFTTNVFYSPHATPRFGFDGVATYATESAWATAAGSSLVISGNTVGTNPYPSGFAAGKNASLREATYIRGITELAADSRGRPLYKRRKVELGHFAKFVTKRYPKRGMDQRLLRMARTEWP